MSLPAMNPSFSSRRAHRKRVSVVRLSTETTATLPEYIAPSGWHRPNEDTPSDLPPDYPDSAEEADEDTDNDDQKNVPYVPPRSPSPHTSPRRVRRLPTHRRRQSYPTPDHFLDSLLERSVHALEMSNALLHSSMSTQSSLSVVLASDSAAECSLEARARGLSSRIRDNKDVHEHWADDLEEIRRGVEGLFGEEGDGVGYHGVAQGSISSSLPASGLSSHARHHPRRPSLDSQRTDLPHLHLSPKDRSHLVSPPPRALTQYVASTTDADSILLPSTLGLRSQSSSHLSTGSGSDSRPPDSNSYPNLHSSVSLPTVTDRPLEPSTAAYNMLSTFVTRSSSSGSSTPAPCWSSARPYNHRRNSSASSDNSKARPRTTPTSPIRIKSKPTRVTTASRSLSPMRRCPPIQELSSSSSDDGCRAKLTVQSLRKILDEQPSTLSLNGTAKKPDLLRAPTFLPRSPPPAPTSGTSTATASVSRLFTKAIHSSSTRPPPPPLHSSMKHPASAVASTSSLTSPATPSPARSFPDLLGLGGGVTRAIHGSTPSSGRSTPKRISFAELPESYTGSRPPGSPPSKLVDKRRRASARKRKGVRVNGAKSEGEVEGESWWSTWLVGSPSGLLGASYGSLGGPSVGALMQEERVEERFGRSWGAKVGAGGGGLDGWAV